MKTVTTLENCPIGLFESEGGELCLKTEYGNNEGRIDAYIVSSGKFFWGSQPQTIPNQRKQLVSPMEVLRLPMMECETCGGVGSIEVDDKTCATCDLTILEQSRRIRWPNAHWRSGKSINSTTRSQRSASFHTRKLDGSNQRFVGK